MSYYEKTNYKFSSTTSLLDIKEESTLARQKQIKSFIKELESYKILLRDLTNFKIEYKIKNQILNIAFFIVNNVELLEKFRETKEIEIEIISKEFLKMRKYIRDWEVYIVAYVLILSNPNYKGIQDYLKVIEDTEISGENLDEKNNRKINNKKIRRGLVLEKKIFSIIILTSDGEFKKIKLKENSRVGNEAEGKIKKKLTEQRFKFIFISGLLSVLIGIIIFNYFKISSTILVKTTSPIVLEINTYDRVKDISSNTEKGKALIEATDLLDKDLDLAMLEIVKYANNNNMIPNIGITITVHGEKIKYGYLERTDNYLFIEGINVKFNNSGIEQELK